MQTEILGSHRILRSFTRPALVFIRMVSPSSRYHIVVSCGLPFLFSVHSTPKRRSCKNARALSDRVVDINELLVARYWHDKLFHLKSQAASSISSWNLQSKRRNSHRSSIVSISNANPRL